MKTGSCSTPRSSCREFVIIYRPPRRRVQRFSQKTRPTCRGRRSAGMRDATDAELVHAARQGEVSALGELVRRHQKQVFALAFSLVGDVAEAEDLAQEAFLRASRNLDLLADPQKFAAWVRRVAFGVCIDWLRAFRPEL